MELKEVNGAEFLPLANARNRLLQQNVRDKRNKLAQLLMELDQNENVVKTAEQDLTTLEQSTQQTHVLAKNIRNQARQEREALNLASTETGTIEQETKRINQKLQQMTKNVDFHKKKLAEQNLDLERLNQLYEEEEKFVVVMEKMVESQLEDHSILDKYSHQDNLTIKELEIKLARTKEDIDDIDRQFKTAKEDRENTAIQLNKMQEEFRSMTEDRDQSLQQWEATVLQSDNCRKQLDKARIDYQAVKELANADQNRLDSINRCIKQFEDDITGLERAFHTRELVANQMKIKIDDLEKLHNDQQSEYVAFEKVAKRLTTEIMGSRKNSENLKHKSIEIQGKLAEAQDKYKQQEKELEDFRRTVGSATAQKESLAILSKAADERFARHRNHLNDIANEYTTVQTDINDIKSKLNSCATIMRFNVHSMRNLENQITVLKQKLIQHEELVYKKSMEIVRVEMDLRRLRHNDGESEERKSQREQIEVLKLELNSSNSHLVALKYEVSKTQSDAIGLQRSCDIQQQKKNVMHTLSKQLESECQSRERESRDLRRDLEEIRMGESLIHLDIKRRESLIEMRTAVVQHLENQKRHIENAIQTRLEELENQMELLQLESRSLKERNQQMLATVNQKATEIDHIKLRYDIVADTLVMENGQQETSEAYFIIKMAQEKEFLKESISDLQNIVYGLESDNSALNSTLQLVSSSNQQFRQACIVGVLTDDDKALKNKMETEEKDLEKMVEDFKKEYYNQYHFFQRLDGELRHLKEEAYRLKIQTEEKLSVGKDLTNEIEQLQTKIDRAKDINLVLQKSIRRTKKTKSKLSEEIDFEIRQIQEKCMSAQTAIFTMTESDPDAKTALVKFLEETAISESREVKEVVLPALPNKTRLEITDFPHSPSSISSPPSMSSSSMELHHFNHLYRC
ncbi:hypothetical protein DAPPUDRAFT_102466 [Daphnia pulex]|uniref:Coiled-coil domain-containing protein 39 n=1 Tax=Daphnia pulex TaxID=6669 RepID=E9GGH9_DAPPU|nr:hypothetical protein DAPPUDRAFT_102466 [Daphnia pulex]|eukprot:EFX81493.1 hypothetical protein DAPPUDRAFT_102466 [Daphnia pulex]